MLGRRFASGSGKGDRLDETNSLHHSLPVAAAATLVSLTLRSLSAAEPAVWRSDGPPCPNRRRRSPSAREIGFNALIFHGSVERMKQWSAMTKAAGIESYFWFSPIISDSQADLVPLAQVMSPEDDAGSRICGSDRDPEERRLPIRR